MAEALPAVDTDAIERPRGGTSRWAMFALGTSLAFCCPVLTIIGPLLAVRALVETRANPGMRGRGMAIAAMWIGVIGCAAWIALLFWWNANVRNAMIHGPQAALHAGMAGDLAAFREQFVGDGATAGDDRANTFLAAIRDRYGAFQYAAQDQMAAGSTPATGREVTIPYVLNFDRGPVKSDVRLLLFARGLEPRLQAITIKDALRGELTYP